MVYPDFEIEVTCTNEKILAHKGVRDYLQGMGEGIKKHMENHILVPPTEIELANMKIKELEEEIEILKAGD